MPPDVEETQTLMRVDARCERCKTARPHEVYVEDEGDRQVLLWACEACDALTVWEVKADDRSAA